MTFISWFKILQTLRNEKIFLQIQFLEEFEIIPLIQASLMKRLWSVYFLPVRTEIFTSTVGLKKTITWIHSLRRFHDAFKDPLPKTAAFFLLCLKFLSCERQENENGLEGCMKPFKGAIFLFLHLFNSHLTADILTGKQLSKRAQSDTPSPENTICKYPERLTSRPS